MVKNLITVAAIGLFSVSANAATFITSLVTTSNSAGAFELVKTFTIANGFTGSIGGDISSDFTTKTRSSGSTNIVSGVDLTSMTFTGPGLVANETEVTSFVAKIGLNTYNSTVDRFVFNTGVLSAGTYTFTFRGTAYGSDSAASTTAGSFTLLTTALPVPEPEYFSMMGLGLALVGLMARRRQA